VAVIRDIELNIQADATLADITILESPLHNFQCLLRDVLEFQIEFLFCASFKLWNFDGALHCSIGILKLNRDLDIICITHAFIGDLDLKLDCSSGQINA